jgi:hypothetical protein
LPFGVSATPFSIAGITSAFWAIVAGLRVALVVERSELLASWTAATATNSRDSRDSLLKTNALSEIDQVRMVAVRKTV